MLTSGDVVDVDFGTPRGREAGFHRPAVIVTSQTILEGSPNMVHVVPLTLAVRGFKAEVIVAPNGSSGLDSVSAIQCQHIRSVSTDRIGDHRGNVGPLAVAQIRETVGRILDLIP